MEGFYQEMVGYAIAKPIKNSKLGSKKFLPSLLKMPIGHPEWYLEGLEAWVTRGPVYQKLRAG